MNDPVVSAGEEKYETYSSYIRGTKRGGSKQYYVKEKHTKYMKKHRRRKQIIYLTNFEG